MGKAQLLEITPSVQQSTSCLGGRGMSAPEGNKTQTSRTSREIPTPHSLPILEYSIVKCCRNKERESSCRKNGASFRDVHASSEEKPVHGASRWWLRFFSYMSMVGTKTASTILIWTLKTSRMAPALTSTCSTKTSMSRGEGEASE